MKKRPPAKKAKPGTSARKATAKARAKTATKAKPKTVAKPRTVAKAKTKAKAAPRARPAPRSAGVRAAPAPRSTTLGPEVTLPLPRLDRLTRWFDPATWPETRAQIASDPLGFVVEATRLLDWGAAQPRGALAAAYAQSPLRAVLAIAADGELGRFPEVANRCRDLLDAAEARRRAVAMNCEAPRDVLFALARDPEPEIRFALTKNPYAPGAALALLATDPEPHIRWWTARHPATPETILRGLADDLGARDAVAENPHAPPDILARLADTVDPSTPALQRLASHPHTPPATLLALAQRRSAWRDEWVGHALAENPATPAEALATFGPEDDWRVLEMVAVHPATPAATLDLLVHSTRPLTRAAVARSSRVADQLVNDPFPRVRAMAAAAATEHLDALARSPETDVRTGLALNPGTGAALQGQLAGDKDPHVRKYVALMATDGTILRRLAKDKVPFVRLWLARNPAVPDDVIALLASDKEPGVRAAAASSPKLPDDHRARLALDDEGEVAHAALAHGAVPWDVRRKRWDRVAARVIQEVSAGRGDVDRLVADPLLPPVVLATLAMRDPAAVAEHPNVVLEDLGEPPVPLAGASASAPADADVPLVPPPPADEPTAAQVPRWTMTFKADKSAGAHDRAGGAPSPWHADDGPVVWPTCGQCLAPMPFIIQIIGTRAGGAVDLGPHAAMQVFACMSGCESWEPLGRANAVFLRARALDGGAVPVPSPAPSLEPAQRITLEPDGDDARLVDPSWEDRDPDGYLKAWKAANTSKLGGVLVCGNEPQDHACPRCGKRMVFFGKSSRIGQPFGSGVAYFYRCPDWHTVSYQAVN